MRWPAGVTIVPYSKKHNYRSVPVAVFEASLFSHCFLPPVSLSLSLSLSLSSLSTFKDVQ